MSKKQNYRNNGFIKFLVTISSFATSMYNSLFNRNRQNTGKAGGHIDINYQSGGGSGNYMQKTDQNTKEFRSKAQIAKIKRRRDKRKSIRINRRRAAGVCSFK